MAMPLTAEDVLPFIAGLPPQERVRLLRMIAASPRGDAAALYAAAPPRHDEFSTDEEPLAWEAEDWENAG